MTVTIGRRELLVALGGAAAVWPLAARAQERPLIAWLSGGARGASVGFIDAFLQGMRELGYAESRNFDVVYRYADGYAERLPALAEELVRLKPKVILAAATGQAVAAKNATATDPNCDSRTRGRGSSGFDSERSSAGRKCHRHNAVRVRIACKAIGTRTGNRARRT